MTTNGKWLISVLLCFTLNATEFSPEILRANDFFQEFRLPLENKIELLFKNYRVSQRGPRWVIDDRKEVHCYDQHFRANSSLASMDVKVEESPNQIIEHIRYESCIEGRGLVEYSVIEGDDLKPSGPADLFLGRRSFLPTGNVTYQYYRLTDLQGQELISFVFRRMSKREITNISVRGIRVFTQVYDDEGNTKTLSNSFQDHSYNYETSKSSFGVNRKFRDRRIHVTKVADPIEREVYFYFDGSSISLAYYLQILQENITSTPLADAKKFIEANLVYFPPTEATSAGASTSRISLELRQAFSRLASNVEINLVRDLIQEYIQAIDRGLIIFQDNR